MRGIENVVLDELRKLDTELADLLPQRNSAALLLDRLPTQWKPRHIAKLGPRQRAWELSGLFYLKSGRFHEALAIFWRLYQHMLAAQARGGRVCCRPRGNADF